MRYLNHQAPLGNRQISRAPTNPKLTLTLHNHSPVLPLGIPIAQIPSRQLERDGLSPAFLQHHHIKPAQGKSTTDTPPRSRRGTGTGTDTSPPRYRPRSRGTGKYISQACESPREERLFLARDPRVVLRRGSKSPRGAAQAVVAEPEAELDAVAC